MDYFLLNLQDHTEAKKGVFLDAGCGSGAIAISILQACPQVTHFFVAVCWDILYATSFTLWEADFHASLRLQVQDILMCTHTSLHCLTCGNFPITLYLDTSVPLAGKA